MGLVNPSSQAMESWRAVELHKMITSQTVVTKTWWHAHFHTEAHQQWRLTRVEESRGLVNLVALGTRTHMTSNAKSLFYDDWINLWAEVFFFLAIREIPLGALSDILGPFKWTLDFSLGALGDLQSECSQDSLQLWVELLLRLQPIFQINNWEL